MLKAANIGNRNVARYELDLGIVVKYRQKDNQ